MQYFEFEIPCTGELGEILMAELSHMGFEGFLQEDEYIKAYVDERVYEPEGLRMILDYYNIDSGKTIQRNQPDNINWNKIWEENYQPVIIGGKCYIRAEFHDPKPQYPYEIIIQPKMAFGTGHHATTAQMMELMLPVDFREKAVLDMGCGTGLLSILAYKMGAAKVTAVDNEEWAYKNTLENFYINRVLTADVILGEIEDVADDKYDIILSNITKNVNIEYIPHYAGMLNQNGRLIVSGFFDSDLEDLEKVAIKCGFRMLSNSSRGQWAVAIFIYDGKK